MHRRQQHKEQFCVRDAMDTRDLDHRVTWAFSYEALPLPRIPVECSDAWASQAFFWCYRYRQRDAALPMHCRNMHWHWIKWHWKGVVNPSDPRSLEPLMSPYEVSGICPSSHSLRNNSRSACMSAPTFIENLKHVNAAPSQHSTGVEEKLQSGNTRLGGLVPFIDAYPWKISELLDREASQGS